MPLNNDSFILCTVYHVNIPNTIKTVTTVVMEVSSTLFQGTVQPRTQGTFWYF